MPSQEPHPIRVMIVDDHQLLTDALGQLMGRESDFEVVGVARGVAETRALLERVSPDVVLMDYRLLDGTGVDAARLVKARRPAARVVMLTGVHDDETILESIQAGADGYLTKDRLFIEVVEAVRAAHDGEILLPREVVVDLAARVSLARGRGPAPTPGEQLTPRELEVLRALAEGLPSPAICERLVIAPNTLRTHVQNIMGKLQVHSKLEAVATALRLGLVEPPRGPLEPG
jgi:DNA-binding NarL/FixJ family response regulator